MKDDPSFATKVIGSLVLILLVSITLVPFLIWTGRTAWRLALG